VTGHPLLVPEAATAFWIAFGAVAATAGDAAASWKPRSVVTAVVVAILAIGIGRAILAYEGTTTTPADYGFHQFETAADGTRFRWMTRHAVTYVPGGRGVASLQLRAPDRQASRPLVVSLAIGGQVLAVRVLDPGQWVRLDVGVRDSLPASFHRVDLRANVEWTDEVRLGRRVAQRPISAMVGEIKWTPIE
jgi:hypothetical protein